MGTKRLGSEVIVSKTLKGSNICHTKKSEHVDNVGPVDISYILHYRLTWVIGCR